MAGHSSDRLLGIRDGFLRYFHDGLDRTVSVAVVPQAMEEAPVGLLLSDEEIVHCARERAQEIEGKLGGSYHFYIASEGGIESLEVDGQISYFVRNWTVVRSPLGEAWGASGAVQIPPRIVTGLDSKDVPFVAVPGRRRSGGMLASITGGRETRRKAIAASTSNALSTLFYGVLDTRGGR